MPDAGLEQILQLVSLLGAALVVGRLYATRLWRNYPLFFAYFVFRIPNTLWPLLLKGRPHLYEHFWVFTEPVTWLFHILVVVELCRLVLNRHRGIYSLLRWAMYGSLAVAIAISIAALLPKIKPHMDVNTRLVGFWIATQRGVDFALAIFILLILFVLSRYPVKLNRNTLVHAALFTVFFFGGAFSMFLHTLFGSRATDEVNLVLEFVSIACIFGWATLLSPHGEKVQTSLLKFSARHEEQALRQLESLNATLLKVSGK